MLPGLLCAVRGRGPGGDCCVVLCWGSVPQCSYLPGGGLLDYFQILFSFINSVALNILGHILRTGSAGY